MKYFLHFEKTKQVLAAKCSQYSALLTVFLLIIIGAASFFIWQHHSPVKASKGWTYRATHENIPKASALIKDKEGNLLVTEELLNGQGRLLSISPDKKRTTLLAGLSKPDGMVQFMDGIVFSQEQGQFALQSLKHGQLNELFIGNSVEGLAAKDQYIYATEDLKTKGRLLRYDATSKKVTVLRSNLYESEAVAICPNGQIFYNEKGKNLVRRFSEDGKDPILNDRLQSPSALFCDARGLWVSEDRTHLARLVLLNMAGQAQVVLSHLRAPQTLLPISKDRYLLAEGGRNRVIELSLID